MDLGLSGKVAVITGGEHRDWFCRGRSAGERRGALRALCPE